MNALRLHRDSLMNEANNTKPIDQAIKELGMGGRRGLANGGFLSQMGLDRQAVTTFLAQDYKKIRGLLEEYDLLNEVEKNNTKERSYT